MADMSEILNNDPKPEEAVDAVEEATEETVKAVEGEKDDTVEAEAPEAKVEPAGEPSTPDSKPDELSSIKIALKQERIKRQELEARMLQAQQKQVEVPDQFEDPEGFVAYLETRHNDALFAQKCNMSHALVVEQVGEEDYEAKSEAFDAAVAEDPTLREKAAQSASPAHFIYKQGKAYLERQQMGDPATYAERMKAAGREEVMSQVDKLVQERVNAELAKHLPKSLASETSAGERTSNNLWDGPKPLDQLLG